MKFDKLEEFRNITYSHLKAIKNDNNGVYFTRDEVISEAYEFLQKDIKPYLLGVKNTNNIPKELIMFLEKKGFLFHTIDKMSFLGRAIDTTLVNPITGGVMSGSTSGGCINILSNINDVAIGTDGGGSVVSPALSSSLYSISLKGFKIHSLKQKKSTDDISFKSAIGVISWDYNICKKIAEYILEYYNIEYKQCDDKKDIVIIIDKNSNYKEKTLYYDKILEILKSDIRFNVTKKYIDKFSNDRNSLILQYENIIENADIIISVEGPIDLNGIGDSIVGSFGQIGQNIQYSSNKNFVKIANMVNSTFVSVPIDMLSTGILIMGKQGILNGNAAIEIGEILSEKMELPQIFKNYFIENRQKYSEGFI